ncbi:MAG: SDR family NAD(P)-dependent oxidoreductase, partial [Candidatus Hydrogenedentes bacterium]|nr:SDR family NAD(P)-dependent oxidoreductase [Candidatus Hydrogenedentota bacterium]
MSGMLQNQVAVVTGAGRGIGAATARLMAEQGAKVVVSDLDAAPADAVVKEIAAAGGTAIAVPGDITDLAFPQSLLQKAVDTYGKLTILVNNAGYTWDGVVQKMTDAQWQAIIDVHLSAPFRMIRAAVPHMREAAKMELGAG